MVCFGVGVEDIIGGIMSLINNLNSPLIFIELLAYDITLRQSLRK